MRKSERVSVRNLTSKLTELSGMKANPLKRLLIAGTLALVWAGVNSYFVKAQRADADLTARLLSGANCVSTGSDGHSHLEQKVENISVGRQLYTSVFLMRTWKGNSVMLTCKVDPKKFSTLDLKFGVSDGAMELNPVFTINIYQAGNKKATFNNVTPGRLMDYAIDLEQSGNVALEIICERANGSGYASVHFFDAQLLPNSRRSQLEVVPAASQTVQPSIIKVEQTTVPSQSVQKPNSNTPSNGSFLNGINSFINDVNSMRRSIYSLFGR